jgi:hypothetical protein
MLRNPRESNARRVKDSWRSSQESEKNGTLDLEDRRDRGKR